MELGPLQVKLVRCGQAGVAWALDPMNGAFLRQGHKEKAGMGQAETRVTRLQACECLQPPEAGRGRKDSPLEPSERACPC